MPEKDKVFESKVKHTGIFDFKELYRFCYTWLADEGYDITEKTYDEKVTGNEKEIEIKWEAKRKISDYFRFVIKAEWRILNLVAVEVEEAGKKRKMDKGRVEIKISGVLEKDYEGRWEGAAWRKFLRGLYDKYIIKSRIEAYEDKLFIEADELVAQVKSFLALEGKH